MAAWIAMAESSGRQFATGAARRARLLADPLDPLDQPSPAAPTGGAVRSAENDARSARRTCLAGTCHNAGMGFDLVIRGATVVTPGHREAADIGIADGRIAQLGGTMAGAEELAAGGLLALPGGVDAHTHLVHQGFRDRLEFPIWVDDFWSGSRAAIAGGITTIGNMTYPVLDEEGTDETPGAAISERAQARGRNCGISGTRRRRGHRHNHTMPDLARRANNPARPRGYAVDRLAALVTGPTWGQPA